jgi:hypothetical protein
MSEEMTKLREMAMAANARAVAHDAAEQRKIDTTVEGGENSNRAAELNRRAHFRQLKKVC